jgi:histidyl-tRNA synthetase
LIIGDREVNEGFVEVKDLAKQSQEKVPRADVPRRVQEILKS